MRAPFSEMPALPAVVGLAAGIFVFVQWGVSPLWAAGLSAVAGALLGLILKRWWESFLMVFVGLGILLAWARRAPEPPKALFGERILVSGKVVSGEELEHTGRYVVDVSRVAMDNDSVSVPCEFRLSMDVRNFERLYRPGDIVAARGVLEPPVDADPDVPDRIDYGRYLFVEGCTARMWVMPTDIAFDGSDPTWFEVFSGGCRDRLADAIVSTGVDSQTATMLLALLIGDDSLMGDSLRENFRDAGLAHMLALSGLHLTILIGMATMLFGFLRLLPGGSNLYLWLIVFLTLIYAIVTGWSPSVSRAAVMVIVFTLGRIIQVGRFPYNTLCVTALVWLLMKPLWLFSVGFQLSLVSVFALIWLNGRVEEMHIESKALRRIIMLVAVPLVCVAVTSVMTVFYFHSFPLLFMFANIIGGILIVPFLALGLILTLFAMCGLAIPFFAAIEDALCSSMVSLAQSFGSLSWSVVDNIYPNTFQIVLWTLSVIAAIWAATARRRAPLLTLCICLVCMVCAFVFEPEQCGRELYICKDKSTQRILLRDNDRAVLFLPAAHGDTALQAEVFEKAQRDYADYMGRRRIRSLDLKSGNFVFGDFSISGNLMTYGDKVFFLLSSSDLPEDSGNIGSVDCLLVCGGFRGDICNAAIRTGAKEILLGADINSIRRRRYMAELTEAGIPCRDLSVTPYRLRLE